MVVSAFITHKKAEHFHDCQDRFSINPDTKSIALSDGMSQSIFQKYWAEILVETYTKIQDWVPNKESVKELCPIWRKKVEDNINEQKERGKKSVWLAERGLREGRSAGATFLGIRFNGLDWNGDVLGDSCLIWVNEGRIKKIYTSEAVDSFDNFPDYFDSNPQNEGKGMPVQINGSLSTGDNLLLVSDPLSDFLLKSKGTAEEPNLIERLIGLNSHREFEELVSDWRSEGMHNDDTTLVIIKPDGTEDFTIVNDDNISELINKEDLLLTRKEEQEQLNQSENNGRENNYESLPQREQKSIHQSAQVQENLDEDCLSKIFDDNFYDDLKKKIEKLLGRLTLNKAKNKKKVNSIVAETEKHIKDTIRKKCQ